MLEISLLLIAGLLFVGSVILFINKPNWPIYLMFFFFPFLSLQLNYNGIVLPVADFFGLLGFISWAIAFFWRLINRQVSLSDLKWPSWPWYFLFIVATGLSIINSFDSLLSLEYFLRNIVFSYFIYLFYPSNVIKDKKEFYNIIKIVFASGVFMAFLSLFYIRKEIAGVIPRINPGEIFGLAPLGYNHNPIAESMLVTAFISFILFLKEKRPKIKNTIAALIIFQALILAMTFSRSAWLAFPLGIGVYILLEHRQNLKQIILGMAVFLVFSSPLIYLMIKLSTSSVATVSNLKRIFFIEKTIELFRYHPILGNGIGTFKEEILHDRIYIMEFGEGGTNQAHGVIWKLLGETGVIGLLTYFSVLVFLGIGLLKSWKYTAVAFKKHLFAILFSLLIALTFFELFQTNYFNQKMWLPISIMFLAIQLFKTKNKPENENRANI